MPLWLNKCLNQTVRQAVHLHITVNVLCVHIYTHNIIFDIHLCDRLNIKLKLRKLPMN